MIIFNCKVDGANVNEQFEEKQNSLNLFTLAQNKILKYRANFYIFKTIHPLYLIYQNREIKIGKLYHIFNNKFLVQ